MFWVLEFSFCQNTQVTILCCLFQTYSVYCVMSCVGRTIYWGLLWGKLLSAADKSKVLESVINYTDLIVLFHAKIFQRLSTALRADPWVPNLVCKAGCSLCCWASLPLWLAVSCSPLDLPALSPPYLHTLHCPQAFTGLSAFARNGLLSPPLPLTNTPHFSLQISASTLYVQNTACLFLYTCLFSAFLGLCFPAGAKF